MNKNRTALSLKILCAIFATDALESVAELFFKKGITTLGIVDISIHNFIPFIAKLIFVPTMWLGVLMYLLNFLLWIAILSRVDLSMAFPVGSLTYIIVPLLSILFLHEAISRLQWLGIALIIAGVSLVSTSVNPEEST